MTTEEDLEKKTSEELPEEEVAPPSDALTVRDDGTALSRRGQDAESSLSDNLDAARSIESVSDEAIDAPAQLGTKRFVYAAYFAGAIGAAFLLSKIGTFAWQKASLWKPAIGEPHDEVVMPAAAVIGGLLALYYWKNTRSRQLAEEVASELSKVTWPSKKEVTNSTTVVIVTTAFATLFFALMDRFWGFVTNLVYGT